MTDTFGVVCWAGPIRNVLTDLRPGDEGGSRAGRPVDDYRNSSSRAAVRRRNGSTVRAARRQVQGLEGGCPRHTVVQRCNCRPHSHHVVSLCVEQNPNKLQKWPSKSIQGGGREHDAPYGRVRTTPCITRPSVKRKQKSHSRQLEGRVDGHLGVQHEEPWLSWGRISQRLRITANGTGRSECCKGRSTCCKEQSKPKNLACKVE